MIDIFSFQNIVLNSDGMLTQTKQFGQDFCFDRALKITYLSVYERVVFM